MNANLIFQNLELSIHQDALQSFALKFTNDEDDAKDLVQDTMLKAIRYSDRYQSGTNLRAWLYTILRNTFINDYRRNSRREQVVTVTDDISSAQLSKSAACNLGEGKFTMNDIQFALKKLQPELYTPFIKYFEGYKYHEIADELNIPIGTVKTRIHVARQLLKKTLSIYQAHWA
ncbi:RNA polymerase sigma factor (sigma-70 family) [Pedobacter sp. UYP24]